MAPEQIEGGTSDARTDIFAFGAVLYEMVAGRKAFDARRAGSVIAAIVEREPPPLSVGPAAGATALERVVATCLAKDPDDRWQSARDLMRELQWVSGAAHRARGKRRDPWAHLGSKPAEGRARRRGCDRRDRDRGVAAFIHRPHARAHPDARCQRRSILGLSRTPVSAFAPSVADLVGRAPVCPFAQRPLPGVRGDVRRPQGHCGSGRSMR